MENDIQTMDTPFLHTESELHHNQELRHRQPFTTDKDVNIAKKHHGHHSRGSSTASNDSMNNFLPGLLKRIGFGSQEFKEKDMHPPKGMRRSSSHGLLKKLSGSMDFGHHHHYHHHHSHGTRDREIFGSEDAEENYREHDDLFGIPDAEDEQTIEKQNSLFGFEDKEFERGEKGRDLFGNDDPNTLSFREKMNIVGPVDADANELERTRHVFGAENAEDSDEEVDRNSD